MRDDSASSYWWTNECFSHDWIASIAVVVQYESDEAKEGGGINHLRVKCFVAGRDNSPLGI